MEVVPFKQEHYWAIELQDAQADTRQFSTPESIAGLEQVNTFTVFENGKIAAIFGWIEIYQTRALMWALIAKTAGTHMTGLTRIAKRLLKGLPYRRIEIEVDCDFEQGHRWAKIMGFSLEVPRLRSYGLNGGDCALYSRITA